MGLDIRWPIGLMFSLIGLLLVLLGLVLPGLASADASGIVSDPFDGGTRKRLMEPPGKQADIGNWDPAISQGLPSL